MPQSKIGKNLENKNKRRNNSFKFLPTLIDELLGRCSSWTNLTAGQLYDEFIGLYALQENIRNIERELHQIERSDREEHLEQFLEWCRTNGVNCSKIDICSFGDDDLGLRAKVDLNEDELIMSIPKKMIMSTETAEKDSILGQFISNDPIISKMQNIQLSLHLIEEYCDKQSFWTNYINILPSTYVTPLYFTPEEILQLKPSNCLESVIKLNRSILRQYAYIWKQLNSATSMANKLKMKDSFTYELYRWSVSTVMTRQNQIPSHDGSVMIAALIPLWDLCNHSNGKLSTDFNEEKDAVLCYAMNDFKANDQIKIFYGFRPNFAFFMHNGFVYENNTHDYLLVKLGISKSDPLCELKCSLCSKANVKCQGTFKLSSKESSMDKELKVFLRIFHMNKDELDYWGMDDNVARLADDEFAELDSKINRFLSVRANLLLKSHALVEMSGQDVKQLTKSCHNILRLLSSERAILESYI